MRFVRNSWRMVWRQWLQKWQDGKKMWGLALFCLALGGTVGVLLATLVADPAPRCLLGDILADTYKPFAVWGLCVLNISVGVALGYVSAREPRRLLLWAYSLAVGYVLGRIATFACIAGWIGVLSLLLCEGPLVLLSTSFPLGYAVAIQDTLLYTLRPQCNKQTVWCAVRYWACGVAVCFVVAVAVWGMVQLLVNIVV